MPGLSVVPLPFVRLGATGQMVKLGRVKSKARPYVLPARKYLLAAMAQALPEEHDWGGPATESLKRMYRNDRLGCCVIASLFHAEGIWAGNDLGTPIIGTDKEVEDIYYFFSPRDQGCVPTEVMDYWRDHGIIIGGKLRKIDGYVAIDNRDQAEVKTGTLIFGAPRICFNVPDEWMDTPDGGVWDVPRRLNFVGGHDVRGRGFNKIGVRVSTWGGERTITWRAFADTRIVDECYVELSPDWYNDDKLSPTKLDVQALREDLAKMSGQVLPPWTPDPTPPPPDPGPTPPGPTPPAPPAPPGPSSGFKNEAISLEVKSWNGNVGTVAGTIRTFNKGVNDAESAMADVQTAMQVLAYYVEDHPSAGKINLQKLLMNLMMVLAAYYTKDPKMIYNAVANLANGVLQDLGIPFQFPPFPA